MYTGLLVCYMGVKINIGYESRASSLIHTNPLIGNVCSGDTGKLSPSRMASYIYELAVISKDACERTECNV
jgi:hypothetical protein